MNKVTRINIIKNLFAKRTLSLFVICCSLFIVWGCGDSGRPVDLKCGELAVTGRIFADRVELSIGELTFFPIILPLQSFFTDEPTAKYAPRLISNPEFAMTITSFVNVLSDGRQAEFMIYSRDGKTRGYELEIGDDKWQCR